MRRIGEIMQDMGFKPGSSEETQKAFILHLIAAANRSAPRPVAIPPEPPQAQQLSFDADILGVLARPPKG